MIISHLHKFVFIAIPKTGTHAVREALRPHLGQFDWEQCNLFEKHSFPQPQIKKIKHGHLTVAEAKTLFISERWSKLYKFCFFRDPIERFLSFMYFVNSDNDKMQQDPLGEMERVINKDTFTDHILLKPQSHFVMDGDNLGVDFIGRSKSMNDDFEYLSEKIIGKTLKLKIANQSKKNKIQATPKVEEKLREIYASDYKLIKDLDLESQPYLRRQN